MTDDELLLDRLAGIAERIAGAATESGRDAADVRMLLATKTQPVERIVVALRAGYTLIGENRVQEITGKAETLQAIPHTTAMIGHLQRNKLAAVLPLIDCLQSLDSADLAARLDRRLADDGDRVLEVMVQVNVSGEPTKSGVGVEQAPALIETIAELQRLRLTGLMTIGLNSVDLTAVRAGYRQLRELRDRLLPGGELSMGMSGDFEAAIAEGGTLVRIGAAAFGPRT
jgi:pyridoxal phosphate enzyme (YggS family)